MRSLKVITPVTMLLLAACAGRRTEERIRVDGSPGLLPLVSALALRHEAQHAGTRFSLASGLGSSARMGAVARGDVDIAMASHRVDTAEIRRQGLAAHEIARTAVVFAVNADVPVRALTRSQVCEILGGRSANWNRYGGVDLAIAPFMRPEDEVDAEVALEGVPCLRGLALGATVRMIARPDSMAAALAATSGAFGVTSATMVEASNGRIASLALDGVTPDRPAVASGAYAMTRRAVLITKAEPSAPVVAFLAFIRGPEGQRVTVQSGAVPVPP